MTQREKELIKSTFDMLHKYLYLENNEPTEIYEIAMLEKDRDKVMTLRNELLGKTLS